MWGIVTFKRVNRNSTRNVVLASFVALAIANATAIAASCPEGCDCSPPGTFRPKQILYVKTVEDGLHDCSSFPNACTLQFALHTALPGDEIWVARGTYMPDGGHISPGPPVLGSGNRAATFQLVNAVSLLGGFAGVGNLRNTTTFKTVLSGDLRANDKPVWCTQNSDCGLSGHLCVGGSCIIRNKDNSNTENSFHVVTGNGTSAATLIDGFTITAGNADGDRANRSDPDQSTYPRDAGAGMFNASGSPTVVNCRFARNVAVTGAGMFNDVESPAITDCSFYGNWAEYAPNDHPPPTGGGMYNGKGSSTVTNCTFIDNSANYGGGGMWNVDGNPTVTDCTFCGNLVQPSLANPNPDCNGGAMANVGASPTVARCRFSKNSATYRGGAFFNTVNTTTGNPHVTNCTFCENSASAGGAIYTESNTLTVTNCAFNGNSASIPGAQRGGGLYNNDAHSTITNCTFSGNSANDQGGGVYIRTNPSSGRECILTNCILWNNSDKDSSLSISNVGTAQIHVEAGSRPGVVTFTDVQVSPLAAVWLGLGNINADPKFSAANLSGTCDDDLRLMLGSPAIGAGSSIDVAVDAADLDGDGNATEQTPIDLAGNPRTNGTVDMGAYESP